MARPSESDPHVLMALLNHGEPAGCLHTWRDDPSCASLQPGELLPLPESIQEKAEWNIEPAAEVEQTYLLTDLPPAVRETIRTSPGPGCRAVVLLRTLPPELTDDGCISLGAFDPSDARPLLRMLEEYEVPFQVEADHSALLEQGRSVALYLGMNPVGSRLEVFVEAAFIGQSRRILRYLYPPESGPAARPDPSEPQAKGSPAMEIYATPESSLTTGRRDFYASPDEK